MKLFKTLFLPAMALSSASAAASVTGGGRSMGVLRAMERGTMESMRALREASPITDSMWVSSAASMPMWRGRNSVAFSSAAREGREDGEVIGGSSRAERHGPAGGCRAAKGWAVRSGVLGELGV